ncbi:hypothetical protein AN958_00900 [Leucoagaricus sp. SymC.cos]|nr:hypothetical protein AN958_00900 [Leucoagaricus sp. SymC.cos]
MTISEGGVPCIVSLDKNNELHISLHNEISEYTLLYIDDMPIQSSPSRYECKDGTCEVISVNPETRRFVWEHLNTVNQIVVRIRDAGGSFSGLKTTIIADWITIVEFECSYKGRYPTTDTIGKILC